LLETKPINEKVGEIIALQENEFPQAEFSKRTWFNKNWLVLLLLVAFPPLGIYALWKNRFIVYNLKIILTIVVSWFMLCIPGAVMELTDPAKRAQRALTSADEHLRRGEYGKAITFYESTLDNDPNEVRAHNQLGLIYLGEYGDKYKDAQKALTHNRRAYQLVPDDPSYVHNLAQSFYINSELDSALVYYSKLNLLRPHDARTLFFLGMLEWEINADLARSREYIGEAVVLDPSLRNDFADFILGKRSVDKSSHTLRK